MPNPLLLFVFALLLPPVAVWLVTARAGTTGINALLTLAGVLPGIIHAIVLIDRGLHTQKSQ